MMGGMNTPSFSLLGAGAVAAAIVVGVIIYLQGFNAAEVACNMIDSARTELQSAYESGVSASVQVYAEEKAAIDERLSQCLSAKPVDPCADAQATRDAAVATYNGIQSPADDAPYTEFQTYFAKREEAYNAYVKARDALAQCRAANPPKTDVPYEQSDTKTCFDTYDALSETARNTFGTNTQTMKAALAAALAALDAREKACHPPTGSESFTNPPQTDGTVVIDGVVNDLASCKLISADVDSELLALRQRAAALPGEIQGVADSIDNMRKRMSPLERDLREVDTYIPPEATKTQFEGALNALRAERKVAIESSLDFYRNLLNRRQAEKGALDAELRGVEAMIAARLAAINAENDERKRAYPTALELVEPHEGACEYYHCHGMLCGIPDPNQSTCGHGPTSESDVDCKMFIDSYLKAAGVN